MTGFKSPVLQKSRICSIAYSLNLRDIEKFLLTASFLCLSGRVTITLIKTHLNNQEHPLSQCSYVWKSTVHVCENYKEFCIPACCKVK